MAAIPSGATIQSIQVSVYSYGDGGDYLTVELYKTSAAGYAATTKNITPGASAGWVSTTADLWDTTWGVDADVDQASFGVRLTYTNSSKANTMYVGSVRIVVIYTTMATSTKKYMYTIRKTLSKPIAHYKMDGGSGTNVIDSSGNNLTGVMSGAITWATPGKFGSYCLDYAADYTARVNAGASTLFETTGDLTICFWVKLDTVPTGSTMFVSKSVSTGSNRCYIIALDYGTMRFNITRGNGTTIDTVVCPCDITITGNWMFFAVTCKSKNVNFVIDTTQYSGGTYTIDPATSSGYDFEIGNVDTMVSSSRYLDGQIDEVRLYNTPLTYSELMDIYVDTNPGTKKLNPIFNIRKMITSPASVLFKYEILAAGVVLVSGGVRIFYRIDKIINTIVKYVYNVRSGLPPSTKKSVYSIKYTIGSSDRLMWRLRLTIGTNDILLYRIRLTIGSPKKVIYRILSTIGALDIIKYHIRTTIGTTDSYYFNIRKTVGTADGYAYSIRSAIGSTKKSIYNIIRKIGSVKSLKYNIRVKIAETNSVLYRVWNIIKTTDKYIYNIGGKIWASSRMIYNIRVSIGAQDKFVYNILQSISVSESVSLKYNIRTAIGTTDKLVYSARKAIGLRLRADYRILAICAASTDILRYNVRKAFLNSIRIKYNVYEYRTSTKRLVYSTRNSITESAAIKYNIVNKITRTSSLLYRIRLTIGTSDSYLYSLRTTRGASKKLVSNIRQYTAETLEIKYSILTTVNIITSTRKIYYNIINKINTELSPVYIIRTRIPKFPVAYYKLDSTSGSIAYDESGNGLNGTLTGVTFNSSGKFNYCADFPASYTARINCGANTKFETTGDMTVCLWVYLDAFPSGLTVFASKSNSTGSTRCFIFSVDGPTKILTVSRGNGTTTEGFNCPQIFDQTGAWHFLAFTCRNKTVRFYIDNAEYYGGTYSLTPSAASTYDFEIGNIDNHNVTGRYLDGRVDELRLYPFALTYNEILEIYNSTNPRIIKLTSKYRILKGISETTKFIYSLQNPIFLTKSIKITYTMYQYAFSSKSLRYNISGSLIRSIKFVYILGPSSILRNLVLSYKIRSAISSKKLLAYNMKSYINKTKTLIYRMLRLVRGNIYFYDGAVDLASYDCSVVQNGDVIYTVVQGDGRDPYVTKYDGKNWSSPVKVGDTPLPGDGHGAPSMCRDDDGYLHVFYGCHDTSVKYARSTYPDDITSWTDKTATLNRTGTYPTSFCVPGENKIYLFLRNGGSIDYDTEYTVSTNNGNSWSTNTLLIDYVSPNIIYLAGINPWPEIIDGHYCIHFAGVFHSYTLGYRNDFVYFRFDTFDNKVYSVGGTDLGTSLTYTELSTTCKVLDTADLRCYTGAFVKSPSGVPMCIINYEYSAGLYKFISLEWNGSSWTNQRDIINTSMYAFTYCVAYPQGENKIIAVFDYPYSNLIIWEYDCTAKTWSVRDNLLNVNEVIHSGAYWRQLVRQPTTDNLFTYQEVGSATFVVGLAEMKDDGYFRFITNNNTEKDISYKLLKGINNTKFVFYKILTSIGHSDIYIYSLKNTRGASKKFIYNTRGIIKSYDTILWRIQTIIGTSDKYIYNTRSSIIETLITKYNIRKLIGTTDLLRYTISLGLILSSLRIPYRIRTKIVKDKRFIYLIRASIIASNKRLLYRIRNIIGASDKYIFNIRGYSRTGKKFVYSIGGRISSKKATIYNIRSILGRNVRSIYFIRKAVGTFDRYIYNVRSRIATIKLLRYNLSGALIRLLSTIYNIRKLVEETDSIRYNIRSLLSNDLYFIYSIINKPTASIRIIWSTFNIVKSIRTFSYFIARDLIFSSIYTALEIKYDVYSKQKILMREHLARYYRDRLVEAMRNFDSGTIKMMDVNVTGITFGPTKPKQTLHGATITMQFIFKGADDWEQ